MRGIYDPDTPASADVAVGGPFFNVGYGEFRIEPSREGGVLLHLSSRHRLTTHFNFYAGLWTDAIMLDLQRGICRIVQRRSERDARSTTEPPGHGP